MLYVLCPFLKGLLDHNANIEHLFNNPKLRLFCYPLRPMCNSHDISGLSHNEPTWLRHLRKEGMIPFEGAFSLAES